MTVWSGELRLAVVTTSLGRHSTTQSWAVTAAQVAAITPHLPGEVERVGVFYSRDAEEIAQTASDAGLTAVQLHGGNGMTREYAAEMLLRDATACTIADGENNYLGLIAASML